MGCYKSPWHRSTRTTPALWTFTAGPTIPRSIGWWRRCGAVCLADGSQEKTRRILRRRSFYNALFSSQSNHCTEYISYYRMGRVPQSLRPCRRKSRTVIDRSHSTGCIFACQVYSLGEKGVLPFLITSQVDQLYFKKA